ncbi:MAG: ComEA family DNA-binding protein [Janthinobacterium lividum]
MIKLLKTLLTGASFALLLAGGAHAKDEAKVAAPAKSATPTALPAATPAKTAMAEPMDLNTASQKDLATLPQIGAARSAAIVKARPYKRKDELVSKKVLTQAVYDGIKDSIVAKQAVKK